MFVHEWGHYIVARIFGVRVETFSIGFGKEIFGWSDKKGTRWKISWLPLGGYVKFFGDASAISNPEKALAGMPAKERDTCFHFKPVWQRFLIVFAGPAINIVFAIFLYAGIYAGMGEFVAEPVISQVAEESPAAAAGFEVGDRILEVNGTGIDTFEQIIPMVGTKPGEEILFLVERGGAVLEITAVPNRVEETDAFGNVYPVGRLGITSTERVERSHSLGSALWAGTKRTFQLMGLMIETIARMITGNVSLDELGGPVKIAQYTGQAAATGLMTFLSFMALISVNLGLVNLLPIPLLDGGHLMFYSIEAIKGSPISAKAQEMAAMIGLAFVLTLLFVLTWNDLNLPGLS